MNRFPDLETLFHRAVESKPQDRAALLEDVGRANPDLRRRLEALLAADAEAGPFLSSVTQETPDPLIGSRVGPYRIERRLGSGGMADVYAASRADGAFVRTVAVKFVRPGIATEGLLGRFRTEREVLGRLRHPHIAQLLDGGVIAGGRPYLVMEFVDGESIDVFCTRRALDLRERLQLFLVVCQAVGFAHRNLVVHRDLKPANILVDSDGAVKLLDFGIAKVLSSDGEPAMTLTRDRMLTPRYASPEQVSGGVVTTVSDVYALGVILYELLTGRSPYRLETTSPSELVRAVTAENPVQPSRAVLDEGTHVPSGPAAQYARRLRGDLDTIVLEALRKEPERRYESVDRLADDVQRYLQGRPVSARPDTLGYRMSRFVKRNRAVTALAAGAGLILIVASVVSTSLYLQARASRDTARRALAEAEVQRETADEVSSFLQGMFASIDPAARQSREPLTVDELLAGAEERLMDELRPEVAARLYRTLGESRRGLASYDEALRNLERALALTESDGPDAERIRTLNALGRTRRAAGDFPGAVSVLERAVAEADRVGDVDLRADARRELGEARADQGRHAEALPLLVQSVALRRTAADPNAEVLAGDLTVLGLLQLRRGDRVAAEQDLREALDLLVTHLGPDHSKVAQGRSNLAYMLMDDGRYDEAGPLLDDAVRVLARVYPVDHPNLLSARGNLARCFQESGDHDRAEALALEIVEGFQAKVGEGHQDTGHAVHNLAYFILEAGDAERAAGHFAEAVGIYERALGPDHPYTAVARYNRARALRAANRGPEAELECRASLDIRRRVLREDHPDIARSALLLGELLLDRGAPAEAEAPLREAVAVRRANRGPRHPDTAWCEILLGECLVRLGRRPEARELLRQGVAVLDSTDAVGPERLRRARALLVEAGDGSP